MTALNYQPRPDNWLPKRPRFTLEDANRAHDTWGCNCGPSALAAMLDKTLDEVRVHLGDFEQKGYTNPTMMLSALESVGAKFRIRSLASNVPVLGWPLYGLARIQWEGPWTKPGVPMRARYRQTHWVGAVSRSEQDCRDVGIFDINCLNNGSGWTALESWQSIAVPFILKECVPRADGKWHITHTIELERPA
jgi:hypothetical protein